MYQSSGRYSNTGHSPSEIYVVDDNYYPRSTSGIGHGGGMTTTTSVGTGGGGGGGTRPVSALSAPDSVVSSKSRRKAGVVVESMAAPNPFCPNSKGVCCLLVLINLGLILVTLGFSIVLQLFEPAFVWYCGILFLIVGFIALLCSLLFCVSICRENKEQEDLYWTHHWQKRLEI
jgi:uncharacterized membrane protein YuzA (DUF378 family)